MRFSFLTDPGHISDLERVRDPLVLGEGVDARHVVALQRAVGVRPRRVLPPLVTVRLVPKPRASA